MDTKILGISKRKEKDEEQLEEKLLKVDAVENRRIREEVVGEIFQVTNPHNIFPFLKLPFELRRLVYKALLHIDPIYAKCDSTELARKSDILPYGCLRHSYGKQAFYQLNSPLGYYRPFSDPSAVTVCCYHTNGSFCTHNYWYPDSKHVEFHVVPSLWHTNRQIRAEARSLYLDENIFLDLESRESCHALTRLKQKMPGIAKIRKMHLLVKSEFFVSGDLADKIFSAEGKKRWLSRNPGQEWRPKAMHNQKKSWIYYYDKTEPESRFAVFQIQIIDGGRGLEIRAPCALIEDHASKLKAYVTRLVDASAYPIVPLNGHDLIRLASYLGTPEFMHRPRWENSAWHFEVEEKQLEMSNDWIIEHDFLVVDAATDEGYQKPKEVQIRQTEIRRKVKVKEEFSQVLVHAMVSRISVEDKCRGATVF
jgi:hypothetical protein